MQAGGGTHVVFKYLLFCIAIKVNKQTVGHSLVPNIAMILFSIYIMLWNVPQSTSLSLVIQYNKPVTTWWLHLYYKWKTISERC